MTGKTSGARFGLLLLFLFVFLSGTAFPDTVKYIYDSLGRLAMTVSSNGTMVVYGYDQAGRLTSATRMSGNQPSGSTPPVLTGITPAIVFIGNEIPITITGSNLLTTDSVTTNNPGIKIVNFSASDDSITIDAQIRTTAATGPVTFTVTTLSGSESVTMDLLNLTFTPSPLVLAPGASESVTARIDGLMSNYDLALTNQSPGVISAPQSVTVPVAGSATFTINALAIGSGAITAGNSGISIYVTDPFTGAGSASSRAVSVSVNDIFQGASIVSKPVSVGIDSTHWYSTGVYSSPVSVNVGTSQP